MPTKTRQIIVSAYLAAYSKVANRQQSKNITQRPSDATTAAFMPAQAGDLLTQQRGPVTVGNQFADLEAA